MLRDLTLTLRNLFYLTTEADLTVKAHTRKKKRTLDQMMEALPVEEIILTLPEDRMICDKCGGTFRLIGKKLLRREMIIIPQQQKILAYYSCSYACDRCEKETGYAGYNQVQGVTHCGCWAHARRKWRDAMADRATVKTSKAAVGYRYCTKLFTLEKQYDYLEDRNKAVSRKCFHVSPDIKGLDARKQPTRSDDAACCSTCHILNTRQED